MVHHGFHTAWYDLKNDIINAINIFTKNNNYNDYNIGISGHSMGASISTLMLADFIYNDTQIPNLFNNKRKIYYYTMGQPRTGNTYFSQQFINNFKNKFNSLPKRIVNKGDIVPHLPPTFGIYHHISNEIW